MIGREGAIVTGGSRGIGRACAQRLARDGIAVVVAYASNAADANAAVAEVVAQGNKAFAVRADVADEQDVARLFDEATRAFGGVDVVMTFILAHELRGRDVTVNAVAPGPTATALFLDGKDDATIARFAHAAPLKRLGTPPDIAEVVAFLTSAAGHWVNGQTIRVNGGIN